MHNRLLRLIASISIVSLTVGLFAYYFATHPHVRQQLAHTSLQTLTSLILLYILSVAALAFIMLATLRLCSIQLAAPESMLLTAWSSIINFFGPLQSGPAFRAVYLKRKHNLSLGRYGTATLVYYFFYAILSGLFLLSGVLGWWLLLLPVFGLLCGFLMRHNAYLNQKLSTLSLHDWYLLALATAAQAAAYIGIYYVELHSLLPSVSLSQVVIYTGAANFALFVSLTPGAIGFRESFLVFSQHLHHIDNATIVTANILDRAVYIVVLLILAAAIFGSQSRKYLRVDQPNA